MRRAVRIVLYVGLALTIVVAGLAVYVTWTVRRSFPELDGQLSVPDLAAAVDVVRDEHGVPTVYADTSGDLFLAQGFVHAQDRFWEMDFRRHVTSGRLAEWFGPDQVETDAFIRTMGWRRVAQAELPLLAPQTRRNLQSYADGVNAYLDQRTGATLSFEHWLLGVVGPGDAPEEWTPVDSLAWLKAMAWDLRGNMQTEAERARLSA
ncbi:MAG: penicillin acylase family protein, partial [Actinomycetota bacterium]|nr:penicillin acylase family protein [Actinomycetota bacterium]